MDDSKIVIGLGNPGPEYAGTRHNLGFDVVDLLCVRHGIECRSHKFHALYGRGIICDCRVHLAKPMTYMNESGIAVREIVSWYRSDLSQVLVICDDVNLPLGKIRVRRGGSSGGHRGLESIVQHLGTDQYPRLRLGIGRASGVSMRDFVLSEFRDDEKAVVEELRTHAADAAETWIVHGVETCMNRFN
ncbi:MAG TPA: aminoacyl-tRNA hydrolase [Planctomycetaceae bacterium]|nr:aminoacyl-tRNA hydrolase [Planctomycetaceae bacterium]